MHLHHLLPLALLTHATPDLFPRQNPPLNGSTLTSAPAFASAAAALAAQYFPSSILPSLAVAIESAASAVSITGNINSIVSSALTATTPPPFITALPSQYQSRFSAIEHSLSVIRSEASVATVRPTTTGNVTVDSTITSMGTTLTTSLLATVLRNGSTSVINTTTTGSTTISSSAGAAGTSSGGAPAPTSSGLAAATRVPLAAAAAGVMGLVGMAAIV